jgi:hypothetical protein
MNTLQDGQVVHLPPHRDTIKPTFRGGLPERANDSWAYRRLVPGWTIRDDLGMSTRQNPDLM